MAVDEPLELTRDTTQSHNQIYRFTWLPSFHDPISITIRNERNHCSAIRKVIGKKSASNYEQLKKIKVDTLTIDCKVMLDFNHVILDAALFWHLEKNSTKPLMTDGAMWLFEANNDKGYKKVYLDSPRKESSIFTAGLYLTKLFDFKDLY